MPTYILETPIVLDEGHLIRTDLNRDNLEAHFAIDNFANANLFLNYESDVTDSNTAPVFYVSVGGQMGDEITDASPIVLPTGTDEIALVSPSDLNQSIAPVSDPASSIANYQTGWGQEITADNTTSGEQMWTKAAYAAYFSYTTTSRAYSNFGAREMFGPDYYSNNNLGMTDLLIFIRNIIAGRDDDTTTNNVDLRLILINGIRDQWRSQNPNSTVSPSDNILSEGDRITFIFHKQLSHDTDQISTGVTAFDPNPFLLKSMVTITIRDEETQSTLIDIVDGYIANANVIVKNPVTFDVLYDTMSDADGKVSIPSNSGEVIIEASGGTDISTSEPFTGELSAMLDTEESTRATVTPLTSLAFESIRDELETAARNPHSRLSLSALRERRNAALQEKATELGITVDDMKSNFIEDASKTNIARVATLIASTQKLITASIRSAKNSTSSEDVSISRKVMRNLGRKMKEMKATLGTGADVLMENTVLLESVATSTLTEDGVDTTSIASQLTQMASNVQQMNRAVKSAESLDDIVKLNGVSSKKAKNNASDLLGTAISQTEFVTESHAVNVNRVQTQVAPDPVTFEFTLVGMDDGLVDTHLTLIQSALASTISLNTTQVDLTNVVQNPNNTSDTDITAILTVYVENGLDKLQANLLAFSSSLMMAALQTEVTHASVSLNLTEVSVTFASTVSTSLGAIARVDGITVEEAQNTDAFKAAMATLASVDVSNVSQTIVQRPGAVDVKLTVSYSDFDTAFDAAKELSAKTKGNFIQAYGGAISGTTIRSFTPPSEPFIMSIAFSGVDESVLLEHTASILTAISNKTRVDVSGIRNVSTVTSNAIVTMTFHLVAQNTSQASGAGAYLDSLTTSLVYDSIQKVVSPNGQASWLDAATITSTERVGLGGYTFTDNVELGTAVTEWVADKATAEAQYKEIEVWDVSQVTHFENLFKIKNLQSRTLDLSQWNVSNVTNMNYMFYFTSNYGSINLDNWNMPNVIFQSVFYGNGFNASAFSAKNWTLGSEGTNSIVANAFQTAGNIPLVLDLSNWTLVNANVQSICSAGTYNKTILGLDTWNVYKCTFMYNAFRDTILSSSTPGADLTLANWNLSTCPNIQGMFRNTSTTDTNTGIILSNWQIGSSSLACNCANMFIDSEITSLTLSNVTIYATNIKSMFAFSEPTTPIHGIGTLNLYIQSGFNASNVRFFSDGQAVSMDDLELFLQNLRDNASADYNTNIQNFNLGVQEITLVGSNILLDLRDNHGWTFTYLPAVPELFWTRTQYGDYINGSVANARLGQSISFSTDGSIMAIGEKYVHGQTGNARVQVLKYDDVQSNWYLIGSEITGPQSDMFGIEVVLNSSGTILSISCKTRIEIYAYDNVSLIWNQRGQPISIDDNINVSMDPSGSIVALNSLKYTEVYEYDAGSGDYQQRGPRIDTTPNYYKNGGVAINSDGTVLAIGQWQFYINPPNDSQTGLVRVFDWDSASTDWIERSFIPGTVARGYWGHSVKLSPDGSVLVVGSRRTSGSVLSSAGAITVLEYDGSAWVQRGADLTGIQDGEMIGNLDRFAINDDATVVAVNSARGKGYVRMYTFENGSWIQIGAMYGEAENKFGTEVSEFGKTVAMNGDGSVMAVGAPEYDGSLSNSGQVQVFTLQNTV